MKIKLVCANAKTLLGAPAKEMVEGKIYQHTRYGDGKETRIIRVGSTLVCFDPSTNPWACDINNEDIKGSSVTYVVADEQTITFS